MSLSPQSTVTGQNFLQILSDKVRAVKLVDQTFAPTAQAHLDDLTKPQGSLGSLEEAATRLFCIHGKAPLRIDPALMLVAAGDHGVVEEGVSAFPQEVTRQMLSNLMAGGAAVNVLCRGVGMDMWVIDAGVKGAVTEKKETSPVKGPCGLSQKVKLFNVRFGQGTANLMREPAMPVAVAAQAVLAGVEFVERAKVQGYRLVATGEVGIGNTTAATALMCAYLNLEPMRITGPGTGLSPEKTKHKAQVIEKALALHSQPVLAYRAAQGSPEALQPALETLAALGGYEIAVLAGVVLGAAHCGLPVLVDGFISTSAYTAALALCPLVEGYAFFAHSSAEPGYAAVCNALGLRPFLSLGLRLGEGTGAALAMPLLRGSCDLYNDMATFSSAQVTGTPLA